MSQPRRARLKVFQAQLGFFDTVVATPSRAAALRAWGVRQDLFASGDARESEDATAVEAALAEPGTPLRRAVGSSDPFALEAASLPAVPDAPRPKSPRKPAKTLAPAPPPPSPDRRALDEAEAAMGRLEAARRAEEAEFRRRREALDREAAEAQVAYVQARRAASATLDTARQAFRAAGGVA